MKITKETARTHPIKDKKRTASFVAETVFDNGIMLTLGKPKINSFHRI